MFDNISYFYTMKVGNVGFLIILWFCTQNIFALPLSFHYPLEFATRNLLDFNNRATLDDPKLIVNLGQSISISENFPFYVEDVVVVQHEQEYLGFDGNSQVPISFEESIHGALKSYLFQQFPKNETKKPLYVRVNRLRINTNDEVCMTSLSLSFFTNENNLITFIGHGASHTLSSTRLLVTRPKQIESSLTKAFEQCFKNLELKQQKMKGLSQKNVDYNIPLAINDQNFPIIRKPKKPGVYHDYDDFINGRIDTTVVFRMHQIFSSDTLIKKAKFERRKERNVWALFDGTHYYHKYKNNFHRLSYNPVHENFDLAFFSKDLSSPGQDATTAFLFGFAGLAISKMIESASSTVITLQMDIPTGMFFYDLSGKNTVIIECLGKEETEMICFETPSDGRICLKSGEYYKLKYKLNDGIIRLQLQSNQHSRDIAFDPIATQRILLEHRPDKIAREFAPFVDPFKLKRHLKKNRKEVVKAEN